MIRNTDLSTYFETQIRRDTQAVVYLEAIQRLFEILRFYNVRNIYWIVLNKQAQIFKMLHW